MSLRDDGVDLHHTSFFEATMVLISNSPTSVFRISERRVCSSASASYVAEKQLMHLTDLAMRVAQHAEQSFKEFGEKIENVQTWDIVHDVNPRYEKSTDVRTLVVYVLLHQRAELLDVKMLRLCDDLFKQFVEKGCSVGLNGQCLEGKDISFTSTSTSAYSSQRLLNISFINVRISHRAAFTIL